MRLALPLAGALLLAILDASAQQAPPPAQPVPVPDQVVGIAAPPPPPLAKGRLTGHVTCNDTRQPARGAMVMLYPMPGKKGAQPEPAGQSGGMLVGRVGLDGSYTVEHVPPGDYAVLAFFPGYLSPFDDFVIEEDGKSMEQNLQEQLASRGTAHVSGEGAQTADVVLERGAAVSGRVSYADGSPATQVNIELEDVDAKPAKPVGRSLNAGSMFRTMFTHQSPGTDDQGHFRLSGIRPGTYRVAVVEPFSLAEAFAGGEDGDGMAAGMGILGGMADPHSLRFYSSDTIHRKSAKTYELRAGDTLADLDLRLPIDGFRSVKVKLVASDGRAINQATVALSDDADDSLHLQAANRGDGVFEFPSVPPGTYTVKASNAKIASRFAPPTAMFADGSAAVLVKDGDPAEVQMQLREVPLPKVPPAGEPEP